MKRPLFWRRSRQNALDAVPTHLPNLGLDFHCHLLPGVDDGMATLDQSCTAIAELKRIGFSGAVLTPHIHHGVFDNGTAHLRAVFAAFSETLAASGQTFALYLAAEYFADEHCLHLIEEDDLLSLPVADERWVMIEFPIVQASPVASACLAALVSRGYRPVIAHVERYRFVRKAPDEWLDRFARANAVLQVNIGSLSGPHGEFVDQFTRRIRERGFTTLFGTDLHRPEQIGRKIVPTLAKLANLGRPNVALDLIATDAVT